MTYEEEEGAGQQQSVSANQRTGRRAGVELNRKYVCQNVA